MKIILANKFYYPRGGDCIHTIGLKKLLEDHGHKVAIFSMQYCENIENEFSQYWPSSLDFSSKRPTNIKEILFRPIYSSEVKQKWTKLLDDFKPDVVHLHNIHSQLSPLISELTYKRNIPVFWTLHDYKLLCPSYSFLRDGNVCELCVKDKKNVIKYRCIKGSLLGSIIGYIEALKWDINKLKKYTTQFISPSAFLMNKMIDSGIPKSKITHLYNFAESNKFVPILDKIDYSVYLGRLSKEKGVETLLKAWKDTKGTTLKIIGDGPLKAELEKTYAAKNIEFLGFLPWEKIMTILGQARFMVIPSEWYENNPLSIIESLALGTPVLGANIGGIPELINNENGRLFNSGNIDDLKTKIEEMIEINDWNYTEISKSASTRFNETNYYNTLMNIYTNKY
jgi:glycosyltransferase involved in cell wall biosynthesis